MRLNGLANFSHCWDSKEEYIYIGTVAPGTLHTVTIINYISCILGAHDIMIYYAYPILTKQGHHAWKAIEPTNQIP